MSTHSRNWLKFGALMALAFVLGLFFAGLLDFPRTGLAQEDGRGGRAPLVKVEAPHIPAAKPLAEISDAYAAIAEAVRPSVVFIQSERPDPQQAQLRGIQRLMPRQQPDNGNNGEEQIDRSSGSGFIVSADGYILTNNHVIEDATRVRVRLLDGRVFLAKVIGTDKSTDVGVLKIDANGLTPAALGESDKVRVGEWVLAIGNPLGNSLTFSVTQGIVSAKGRGQLDLSEDGSRNRAEIQDFIQTDAAINRGNSGGPLMNVRGEVIGINSAIASYTGFYSGYAFAVPIDLARKVMNQIIARGKVERAGLDISVETADAEDAEYLGLDSIAGVRITDFGSSASPARAAGLEAGDVIVSIDGQPVRYVAQLQQIVGFKEPGTTVRVEAVRKSGRRDFTVRLVRINSVDDGSGAAEKTPVAPKVESAPLKNRLGITVEPVTAGLASQIGIPTNTRGLMVRSVQQGVPAEEKLVPIGIPQTLPDVITTIEGKPVRTEAELKAALAEAKHNIVTLTVTNGLVAPGSRVVRVRLAEP